MHHYFLQLICSSLDALVHGDRFNSVDGNISLLTRVAALHVAYQMNRSQVLLFGQLVALYPGIMVHLSKVEHDKNEMVLQLYWII